MHRRVPVEVCVVVVDPLVPQQGLSNRRPAVLRGQMERRVAVVVALVHVRALQKEVLDDVRPPVLGGDVQDAVAWTWK